MSFQPGDIVRSINVSAVRSRIHNEGDNYELCKPWIKLNVLELLTVIAIGDFTNSLRDYRWYFLLVNTSLRSGWSAIQLKNPFNFFVML